MKVYIVEDSRVMVERIQSKVRSIEGVELVGVSGDEADALADIRRVQPDFLIVDIRLKSGDGIDLLKKVKDESPETTVAMLTSYHMPEFFHQCKEMGADFFFDKAKDFNKIENAIMESKTRMTGMMQDA
jgi:DNA-binding NarL/FixJ family response regulator